MFLHPAVAADDRRRNEQQHLRQQQPSRSHQKALTNMPEDIVSELMPDDEEAFIDGSLLNRGIPDHHALRSSQPRHISVDSVRFPARHHQKHALRWNGNTGMFRKFFYRSNQICMLLAQGLELVE